MLVIVQGMEIPTSIYLKILNVCLIANFMKALGDRGDIEPVDERNNSPLDCMGVRIHLSVDVVVREKHSE